MASVTQSISAEQNVVDRVREALRGKDYRPFELMAYLENHYKLDDAVVREALWNLLSGLEIEFTGEQKLRLRKPVARSHK